MIRVLAFLASLAASVGQADTIKLAVTTSFHNSGLSDVLLPQILEDTGLQVQLLVVGTGQAVRLGEAGDVDAILIHSRSAEDKFVAEGYAPHRREIMYNDFVVIGPMTDPATVAQAETARDALERISTVGAEFVSRGDDSGTHKKELALWRTADRDPAAFDEWYKAVGAGMGAALNTASGLDAYILADRASWLNFSNKGGLGVLFEGDPELFNQYAYLPIDPARHPHVNAVAATKLEDWLTGPQAAALISGYQIDGETLFFFNATD